MSKPSKKFELPEETEPGKRPKSPFCGKKNLLWPQEVKDFGLPAYFRSLLPPNNLTFVAKLFILIHPNVPGGSYKRLCKWGIILQS